MGGFKRYDEDGSRIPRSVALLIVASALVPFGYIWAAWRVDKLVRGLIIFFASLLIPILFGVLVAEADVYAFEPADIGYFSDGASLLLSTAFYPSVFVSYALPHVFLFLWARHWNREAAGEAQ